MYNNCLLLKCEKFNFFKIYVKFIEMKINDDSLNSIFIIKTKQLEIFCLFDFAIFFTYTGCF